MAPPVDLVIADKNPLVVSGLQALVARDGRWRVVATVADGESFLAATDRLAFDVALVGWVLPALDGAAVLRSLRGRPAAPRIVVYTGAADPDIPRQAMALGAAAFCHKSEPPERVLETLAAVAEGRMVFPILDVRQLYHDPLQQLTPRELELLQALSEGASNGQLAERFEVSVNTVKFHLKNLYDKCTVRNRAQAVAFYLNARRRVV